MTGMKNTQGQYRRSGQFDQPADTRHHQINHLTGRHGRRVNRDRVVGRSQRRNIPTAVIFIPAANIQLDLR
jgi:hypothetical protein